MVHSICVWAPTQAAFSADHMGTNVTAIIGSLYCPDSFASPIPRESVSFFNSLIHSLNTYLLSIYRELELLLGAKDTAVNKTDKSPCPAGPFSSFVYPPPSMKKGATEYASLLFWLANAQKSLGHRWHERIQSSSPIFRDGSVCLNS